MSAPTLAPPTWDMQCVFPGIESTEFKTAFADVLRGIDELEKLFESSGIKDGTAGAERLPEALAVCNAFRERLRTVSSYIYAFVTTDSRDYAAQAAESELRTQLSRVSKLTATFTAWIGSLDSKFAASSDSTVASHAFALTKAKEQSNHLMSPDEEELAADLAPSGGLAWAKLHGNVGSQIEVEVELPDGPRTMAMSAVRSLAYDANGDTRRAAYQAELDAWKRYEVPMAAAMNGVKGETLTLARRRGWNSPLDEALFNSNIDRATLDAMHAAVEESLPVFRAYLRAKARLFGGDRLAWFDLFAPVGGSEREWTFEEGAAFVERQFSSYSERMGSFAARAFRERWIDAPPKPGKRDGAYCMGLRADESRILMNFKPAFGSVSTLAHELGHAYHNLCLADKTPLQRQTPMTLAETASIFCETVVRQAALSEGSEAEQLTILEAAVTGACQTVVDISSRFRFEQEVFNRRSKRELSPAELCSAMLDAQEASYGDGLDADLRHEYMWAAKPHYYGRSFYNFPYTFGLLFSTGLYARFLDSPQEFRKAYDDLLSSTGLADAAELAARFGIDVRSVDFWRSSLEVIGRDIERLVELLGRLPAG